MFGPRRYCYDQEGLGSKGHAIQRDALLIFIFGDRLRFESSERVTSYEYLVRRITLLLR